MTEEPKKKGNAAAVTAVLVLLPVFYVLSIGPVFRYGLVSPLASRWIVKIYDPLEWIYQNVHWTRKPLEEYLRMWGIR